MLNRHYPKLALFASVIPGALFLAAIVYVYSWVFAALEVVL